MSTPPHHDNVDTALRFFDTQPTGRILNRFSKDVDYVDDLMPLTAMDVCQLGLQSLAVCIVVCIIDPYVACRVCRGVYQHTTLFVGVLYLLCTSMHGCCGPVCIATPLSVRYVRYWDVVTQLTRGSMYVCLMVYRFVLLIVIPCVVAFFALRKFYVKTSREVKRIEGTSRSPLYAHLSMTMDGLAIVRSFPGAAERILNRFGQLHDMHTRSWFTFLLTGRWLGFRLDLIVTSLVVVTSFSAVAQRSTIGAGGAGLSLAYIMQLTGKCMFVCACAHANLWPSHAVS